MSQYESDHEGLQTHVHISFYAPPVYIKIQKLHFIYNILHLTYRHTNQQKFYNGHVGILIKKTLENVQTMHIITPVRWLKFSLWENWSIIYVINWK